jgi:hypothetical protein
MAWAFAVFLAPTPVKIRLFDLIMLGILLSSKRDKKSYVPAMRTALLVLLGTTVSWFVFGLTRGGEVRFASWQTYLILSAVLVAFTVAATHKTAADFRGLARWLLAAALYRALMCWISYFTWARAIVGESGAFLTTHDDTICWVVSVLVLVAEMIEKRATRTVLRNLFLIVFLMGAIQFNSRRIAWVSLAMGVAVLYFLIPYGKAKKRINRVGMILAPIVLLYVVVGWGRASPIFLPLRSLSTVSTQEDGSTLARNAENLGLIATAKYASFLTGTGWGRPYVFLTMKYDISGAFELWRYIPHNSILGLLAFTGVLGFIGFWTPLPTSVFLNARVARMAADPRLRTVGLVGAAQLIVACNQLYGDMGLFSLDAMYVMAVSYAIALRVPVTAGVWDTRAKPAAGAR